MDAADKRTQELRLQSELTHIAANKEKMLAELGREVLIQEGSSPAFAAKYAECIKAIGDFEAQEEALRQRIEALLASNALVNGVAAQAANATARTHACPVCGEPVTLDDMFCSACGDNLATLKANFKRCPNCGIYHPAKAKFCDKCGSGTEEIEVARNVAFEEHMKGD